MKRILWALALMFSALTVMAQSAGDKIVGTYKAVQDGEVSKVKIYKVGNGYRAQVCWLEEPNDSNGKPKLDSKNPDKAKRSVRADQIVLIDKVVYKDGVWTDGEIYDPTAGKTYTVNVKFKDAKTLAVTGSLLFFKETVYWTKLD